MKTKDLLIVLLLILTFSCKTKKSEIKSDSKIEIEKKTPKTESYTVTNFNQKKSNENVIFRNITDLEKYNGFEEVSAQILGTRDKASISSKRQLKSLDFRKNNKKSIK